jgi:3-oxoadipate enol-lactonase
VIANSLGSSMRMWDKVLSTLEQDNRVLRFDMRGHGKSQVAKTSFTIEDLGRDVLQLLDELQVQLANVCGLSLGGIVALWLGIYAPERVHRIVFANTAARIGNRLLWDQRMETVKSEGMSLVAAATIGRWFTPTFHFQHPEEVETIRAMIAATNPAGYAACCSVLCDADLQAEAGRVVAPSLVIAGAHDPATPPKDARALNVLLQNSKYVELDASHLSAWESADQFAAAVVQHLTAGDQGNG